jgi:hypothetical protein
MANVQGVSVEDSRAVVGADVDSMVWIPGGTFRMGSDQHYPEEAPAHKVHVDGFWIDRTPVTNREFRRFVEATGYVTFAEIAPDPKDYPGALPHMLKAGSLVFTPPGHAVDLRHFEHWWRFTFGANWRHPYGRASSIMGMGEHPVVHLAYCDVQAYAAWVGKQLPTEAQWEYAARGGIDGAAFAWGEHFTPDERHMANTWQGDFPNQNLKADGYERTSPVTAFPPNGYGLYDIDRQRVGVDLRLVLLQARSRPGASVLRGARSARRARGRQLRPLPAAHQDSSQGAQGRLPPVRTELLPALPAGRAPCAAGGHFHQPRGLSLHHAGPAARPASQRRRSMSSHKRRTFITTGLLSAGAALVGGATLPIARAQSTRRPNILFILVDNLGYGELGVYGGGATRGAPTPRIDRLAAEGLRLTNMNMETQCTPSRSAILTGRHAIRSGTHSVPSAAWRTA